MSQVFRSFRPEDVQAAFAAVLVDEWVRGGVTDAVASPGSRSTPLLVALAEAAEAGRLRLHVLLDERAAGFFALGLGKASGTPAPVVTTSGTAAAELHAAVIEADHAGVPMLAVTADRPAELHDWGAPQTVKQVGLFGPSVRWEASPGVPEEATAGTWRSLASRALLEATGGAGRPGPVHLNLAFREPLIGRAGAFLGSPGPPSGGEPEMSKRRKEVPGHDVAGEPGDGSGAGALAVRDGEGAGRLAPAVRLLGKGRPNGRPWHRVVLANPSWPQESVLEDLVGAGQEGLVVAGAGAGSADALRALSEATGWPVMADPLSGSRWQGAICAADALLRTEALRGWRPAAVLRLGSPWASRVLNEWLAGLDCAQWLVSRWGEWPAPDRLPAKMVVAGPEEVCWAIASRMSERPGRERAGLAVQAGGQEGGPTVGTVLAAGQGEGATGEAMGCRLAWRERWALAEQVAQRAIDEVLSSQSELTGPLVARTLTRCLPHRATLVVSSSMPVRDLEWWGAPREDLRVLCNRGANGIDGVLSTALGAAAAIAGDGGAPGSAPGGTPSSRSGGRAGSAPGGTRSRVVALLGDLAFAYDASALLWAQERGTDLDVVVVDNAGGGIFSFLPQARLQPRERFERLWGTPHGTDLVRLARSFGAPARVLEGPEDLAAAVCSPAEKPSVRVWVASTSREAELALREALWSEVQEQLRAAFLA